MEVLEKEFRHPKTIRVPLINEGELVNITGNGYIDIMIGITSKQDEEKALIALKEAIKASDSTHAPMFNREYAEDEKGVWRKIDDYQFLEAEINDPRRGIVNGNFTGYEKIFWYSGKMNDTTERTKIF